MNVEDAMGSAPGDASEDDSERDMSGERQATCGGVERVMVVKGSSCRGKNDLMQTS